MAPLQKAKPIELGDTDPERQTDSDLGDDAEQWPSIKNLAPVPANAVSYDMMTVKQLKELCRTRMLKGYLGLGKNDLIKLLNG